MHRVEFDGGWLDLRAPDEVTVKGRRMIRAAMTAGADPFRRIQTATDLARLELSIPAGGEPTPEQNVIISEKVAVQAKLNEAEWDQIMGIDQLALVAAIAGWSLTEPIHRDTLEAMSARQYDQVAAAGKNAAADILQNMQVDFSVTEPELAKAEAGDPTGA
jgi:hypothetical protein